MTHLRAQGRGSSLYEPIDRYKPLADGIGVVDGGFEYMSLLGIDVRWPFTTRMTVIRLADGDLFLHSPTAFDPELAKSLSAIGTIRHLVSPNKLHYAHIGEWARSFPHTITWASPHVRERARSRGVAVSFERDLGPEAPPEWRAEIDQTIIPGAVLDEVVFFHRRSRTLIVADTIANFEADKLGQPYRLIARLFGVSSPFGGMPLDMRIAFWPRRRKVRAAFETILSWRPERLVLSHGRCYDTEAYPAVERAFRWAFAGPSGRGL